MIETQLIDYQNDFNGYRDKILFTFEFISNKEIDLENGLKEVNNHMTECTNIVQQMEIQAESQYMKKEHSTLANKLKELKKEIKIQTEKLTFKMLMGDIMVENGDVEDLEVSVKKAKKKNVLKSLRNGIKNATNLAKGITGELQGQKEKVLKSKEKVYEMDADLSGSNTTLNSLNRIRKREIYIFYTVIAIVVIWLFYQLAKRILY